MRRLHDSRAPLPAPTANDRFKSSFESRFWASIIAATALHLFAFTLFPAMSVAEVGNGDDEIEMLELPPEVDIPDAPPPITRPAFPVPFVDAPSDVTIEPSVPEDGSFAEMPRPPERESAGPDAGSRLTPWTVRPEVRNRREVGRVLEREYPALLRDAGIGGEVVVSFFIDEAGTVRETRLHESSGCPAMDRAALEVADVFEFTPALNRDEAVPVWIQLSIVFEAR